MNAKPKWGISEYLRLVTAIAGGVCIGTGIHMAYQGKAMSIANISIPAGLIFLIAGLILFGVASRRSTPAEHSSSSSKFWYLMVLILVVAGISLFSGYWLHKSLYSAQSVNPQVAPNLEQNLNALARENIDWAREVINRADRLVTYGSIAIGTIIGVLGLYLGIFGAKWIRQHKNLVESHQRMSRIFLRCEEEALSMAEDLALPSFAIRIMDEETMEMIRKRLEEMEDKIRPIEEIDQAMATLEFFQVKLAPKVFIQLGHYYRYQALIIQRRLEKKKKRGLEEEEAKEQASQMRKMFFKALDRYRAAGNKKKDFTPAYYNMGIIHLALRKWLDALHCFDKAIKINANRHQLYFEPYYGKGVALDELNRFEEAIETYDMAYQLKPDYVWIAYNIGCSYTRWGEQVEGVREEKWQKAIIELGKVFHIKKIREKARADSELGCLRKDEGYKDLFSSLIEWRESN